MTTKVKAKGTALPTGASALADMTKPFAKAPKKAPGKAPWRRGRRLLASMFRGVRFRRSLEAALEGARVGDAGLGVSPAELRRSIIRAYHQLGKKRVTAADWVGATFEDIGSRLKKVRIVVDAVAVSFVSLVNTAVAGGGAHITNGYGEVVFVQKKFSAGSEIVNIRIRRPGQKRGRLYVDRARLSPNKDGQYLLGSVEYKTRGAAKTLKEQTTRRDVRLVDRDHPPGTVITFEYANRPGVVEEIDIGSLLLPTASTSGALREAGMFSRVGIAAGPDYRAEIVPDGTGDFYIRITVAIATDPVRRTLARLLRDRSWQR